jgi:hypothetical protein
MQGCDHVAAATVTCDPHKGWFISASKSGHANNSDVQRAVLVAEADLCGRFDLAWGDDKTG